MTDAPSYAETLREEELIDDGGADEVGPPAVRGLEEKAGEDRLGGRRLQRPGRFPHSRRGPMSAPPAPKPPSPPNISTSPARPCNPRSPHPHPPPHLPLPSGEGAPVSSPVIYFLDGAPTARREILGGPASASVTPACMPTFPPQLLPAP